MVACLEFIFSYILHSQATDTTMRRAPGILVLLLYSTGLLIAQELRQPIVRFNHPILNHINSMIETRQYKKAINLSLVTAEQMKAESNWEGYISFMLRAAEIETFEVWKGKGFGDVGIYPDYRRPLKYLHTRCF